MTLLLARKIGWYCAVVERGEKTIPGGWPARQNHIPCFRVLTYENFFCIEAIRDGQTYRLAATVGEWFGDLANGFPSLTPIDTKAWAMAWDISRHIPDQADDLGPPPHQ